MDLISLDYGPFDVYWHTPFDTVGKCSAGSLGIVERVALQTLADLESGRLPKPTLAFARGGAAGIIRFGKSQDETSSRRESRL